MLAAEGTTAYGVAGVVSRSLPRDGLLVVGASSPIRDLDLMVAKYEVGGRRKVIANRGLSGIDGTVSSAIGAALGRSTSSRAIALMGDVTFLHDANGLVLGPDEPRPDLTIVVVNDDGGSIFAMLEQGDSDVRRPLRPAVRHPPPRRPRQPVRGHPHSRTGRSSRSSSSSTPWPTPTAGSRSSRCRSAATTAASSTSGSARSAGEGVDQVQHRPAHPGRVVQLVQVPAVQRRHRPSV